MSQHLTSAMKQIATVSKFSTEIRVPLIGDPFGPPPSPVPIGNGGGPCAFLSGTARTICEQAVGIIGRNGGNGGNGGTSKKLTGTGCVFPLRRDPISGQCKLFVGTQEGPDPGRATVGGFGLPAMVPDVVGSIQRRDGSTGPILRCMRGMVLGIDSLCYPKAVLPRRSKFRKWRGDPRPVVSAGDLRAIRKTAAAKDRVLNLAKDVGLFASKTRPSPRPKAHQHAIAAPIREAVVISEHTN